MKATATLGLVLTPLRRVRGHQVNRLGGHQLRCSSTLEIHFSALGVNQALTGLLLPLEHHISV